MSSVTFNRNRAKLKKLLGIRARLALLAVILVAPLMLERVRSLEDTRAKQIARASEEFTNLTQHSADTQREVISSVETMLKSAAYIRASGGIARSCEILRASLPTNLPWIRSIMIVSSDGLVQCSTLNMQVGLNIGDREYFRKAQETRDFVFSDYLFGKTNNRPMMMAAYPVSAINPEEDAVVVAGINLDWMSKIMTNLGGRPGISSVAGRQRRRRARRAVGPGQHGRPAAGFGTADGGGRGKGVEFRGADRLAVIHRFRRLEARAAASHASPERNRA